MQRYKKILLRKNKIKSAKIFFFGNNSVICIFKTVDKCDRFENVKIILQRMIIGRPSHIDKLLAKRWNGKTKIITGLRRYD